jgi:hypothetical protein
MSTHCPREVKKSQLRVAKHKRLVDRFMAGLEMKNSESSTK